MHREHTSGGRSRDRGVRSVPVPSPAIGSPGRVVPVITLAPTTARRAVQAVLRGSGLLAVATGTWVVARGSAAVPDGETVSSSTDSVLRFYATWWAGAGVVMWRLADAPERHPAAVRAVAATTFVGGLARLLAARTAGRRTRSSER